MQSILHWIYLWKTCKLYYKKTTDVQISLFLFYHLSTILCVTIKTFLSAYLLHSVQESATTTQERNLNIIIASFLNIFFSILPPVSLQNKNFNSPKVSPSYRCCIGSRAKGTVRIQLLLQNEKHSCTHTQRLCTPLMGNQ